MRGQFLRPLCPHQDLLWAQNWEWRGLKAVPDPKDFLQGFGGIKSLQKGIHFDEMNAIVLGVDLPDECFLSPNGSDPRVLSTDKVQVAAGQEGIKLWVIQGVDEFNGEEVHVLEPLGLVANPRLEFSRLQCALHQCMGATKTHFEVCWRLQLKPLSQKTCEGRRFVAE